MITKLVLTGSYDFDAANVALVPLHRYGVDADFFTKRASDTGGVFEKEIAKLAEEGGKKDHTVLHVLAVGDSDTYGDNRNHDGFTREDNIVAHPRFKTQGHVFKHHRNTSPQLKTGSVLATAHNSVASRIELLIALENAKYAEELDGFAKGEDIPVSMGSLQRHDVCSLCGHKAPTAKDHCTHIKNNLGDITADGKKIYMENPDPGYFDISTVHKPADRIGYALRKVASHAAEPGGHELAEIFGVTAPGTKKAMLVRLAEIEKHTPAVAHVVKPSDLKPTTVAALKTAAATHGIDAVLHALHDSHYMLSFNDFMDVVVGESKYAGAMDIQVPFGSLDTDSEITSLDGNKQHYCSLRDTDLSGTSMVGDAVVKRAMTTIIVPNLTKRAGDALYNDGCSRLYAFYKLAFVAHPSNSGRNDVVNAVALTTRPLRH